MANEVLLQEGTQPVDENLRPLKVGGKATSIELAQHGDGAKINGDLTLTGKLKGKTDINIEDDITCDTLTATTINNFASTNLTIDDSGDITLDAGGGNIYFKDGGITYIDFQVDGSNDKMTVFGSLQLIISDDFLVDTVGDIILDSADGNFIAKKAGTEFSAANSSYAGMILGYTVIGLNATPASYVVTNAMVVTDATHKVSGVVPPSGNIEIYARIWAGTTQSSRPLTFGLSDNASWNSVAAHHESVSSGAGGADYEEYSTATWYITGLTAGDGFEYWFAAGCTTSSRWTVRWGGDSSSVADSTAPYEYQPFIMKATALPATIYTG